MSASLVASISERFVGDVNSVASLDGVLSLWYNPAGLSFMGGSEAAAGYLYEWHEEGRRHHVGSSFAVNLLDIISLGGGINSRVTRSSNLGSDLSGVFATSLKLSDKAAFGISFLKSHYFHDAQKDTMVSLGFQARPTSYLAIGGLYQEIHDGYFNAPNLIAGIALRPFGDNLTLNIDTRFHPKKNDWGSGFRVDPILGLKVYTGGFGAAFSAEIPGIKEGWTNPIFFAGIEINFAHLGININSHIHPAQKNYSAGGYFRSSTEEWRSIDRPSGLWVELNLDSGGNIERKTSVLAALLEKEQSPLSVLNLLRRIKNDSAIAGIIIHLNGFAIGDGRAQEWRDALLALRQANKQVFVYLDSPSERDYYIASAANKIFMNRHSSLSLHRFQATLTYLADLLEKVGVKAEAIAAGSYKTAPRMWTHSRAQKEEIEVYSNILNSFYKSFLGLVSKARNIDEAKLKEILDGGEITAQAAKELGLIDDAIFKDELMKSITGSENKGLPMWASYQDRTIKNNSWSPPKKIVVIPIAGEIVDGRVLPSLLSIFGLKTGATDVIDIIEAAASDPQVAGIIVRLNSPGGDAIAGDKIHRVLKKAREKIPIVASMGDVAASAAYMIATGAHHIIAEPNTVTGSIGVFSLYFSAEALAKKAGVNAIELAPIKNPGPTYFRPFSAKEREQTQKIVDWYYQNFITTVATSLDLDEKIVSTNAEGRVWLGHEAFEKKLVHELGGFCEAIDSVRLLAESSDKEDLVLEIIVPGANETFSLTPRLMSLFSRSSGIGELKSMSTFAHPYIKAIDAYRLNGQPQARLPFEIEW